MSDLEICIVLVIAIIGGVTSLFVKTIDRLIWCYVITVSTIIWYGALLVFKNWLLTLLN